MPILVDLPSITAITNIEVLSQRNPKVGGLASAYNTANETLCSGA